MTPLSAARLHYAVTVGFAILLLVLGLPQAIDSVLRLYAGGDASGAAAVSTAGSLHLVDRWFEDPGARIIAGVRELSAARAASLASPDFDLLSRASDDLASGLAREPASALGWTALAETRIDQGDTAGAVDALHASLLVASYDQSLSLWRSELGFDLWTQLDADDRPRILEQVRVAFDTDPNGLVALARRYPATMIIIRLALFDEPEPGRQFEEFLRRR